MISRRGTAAVAVILCWLLCLALTVTAPIDRDEHMYQAAAALLGDGMLYTDIAFPQTPYSVYAYAALQRLVPGDAVLLPARLFKAALSAGLLLAVFGVCRRLGAGPVSTAALIVLLCHDSVIRGMVGAARNYDPALLAVLGGLLLLPIDGGDHASRARLALAGALAGVAVGFKLLYAPLALVLVLWPPVSRRGGWRWVLLGAALALAPLAVSLRGVDLETLRCNLLDYHVLNGRWHDREGLGRGLDAAGKLRDAARLVRETDHLMILITAAAGAGLAAVGRGKTRRSVGGRLVAAFGIAALVILAVPRPLQHAYYAPLLLAGCLAAAASARHLDRRRRRVFTTVAVAAAAVAVGHHLGDDIDRGRRAMRPGSWPAVELAAGGRRLAALTASDPARPIVTVHPLYALEAGRRLDRGFAAGEFGWRLDDLLDGGCFPAVTPGTLDAHLAVARPSAIVVEDAAPWDGPLVAWCQAGGWRPVKIGAGVTAWLPPARSPERGRE